ncbi:hypothetical protein [Mycobacterium phage Weirdo19]|uniref:Uncharacterized protein n=1 Tax=Mycobacterium phage Weirdo19 TaxID=2601610 RepID=A0A6M2YSU4_9CAUD|nr:hypothetical protein KDJ11_gp77 [Mycobacterium phage Weirdo19]QEA10845.1 hypothetical protein [Mycobacterium phage Weirdo19]
MQGLTVPVPFGIAEHFSTAPPAGGAVDVPQQQPIPVHLVVVTKALSGRRPRSRGCIGHTVSVGR